MKTVVPAIGLGTANLLQATLPDFIDAAEDAGFKRITARPYAFVRALESGWTEAALQARLREAGITVTMIDGHITAFPGTPKASELDDAIREKLPPEVLDPPDEATCFRAANVLGASLLNVAHYMGPTLPLGVLADALRALCARAAPFGIRICVEFFPDSGFPNLAFTQAVVEASGAPNAAILLDVFHLDRSGGTLEDIRRLPPHALAGIQVSDRAPAPTGTAHIPLSGRKLPGDGQLPLAAFIEAALENSPDATVDLEVLSDELRGLPSREVAHRLADAMASWLEGSGIAYSDGRG